MVLQSGGENRESRIENRESRIENRESRIDSDYSKVVAVCTLRFCEALAESTVGSFMVSITIGSKRNKSLFVRFWKGGLRSERRSPHGFDNYGFESKTNRSFPAAAQDRGVNIGLEIVKGQNMTTIL